MLVHSEEPGALVKCYPWFLELAQTSARRMTVVTIERVGSTHLRDKVGGLGVSAARGTPHSDVRVGEALAAMLNTGDFRVMEARDARELASRETRVQADLPETVAERVSCSLLFAGHRCCQPGLYSRYGTPMLPTDRT